MLLSVDVEVVVLTAVLFLLVMLSLDDIGVDIVVDFDIGVDVVTYSFP